MYLSVIGLREMTVTLTDSVGFLATITTVCLALTGIPTCKKIWRIGSTGDISPLPFITATLSGVLWLKYGIMKEDWTIILVNLIGSTLQGCYTIFYYYMCSAKVAMQKQLLVAAGVVFPLLIYTKYVANDYYTALNRLGIACCLMGVIFFGSPLVSMGKVIRLKSTECMSFYLSFVTFLVSLEWWIYGWLINDYFIQVPNFLGTVLGTIQLALFLKYPSKSEDSLISRSVSQPVMPTNAGNFV